MYQIEMFVDGAWDASAVGSLGNQFDSEAEAKAEIEELRKLGDDWADGEYRVVETEEGR